MKLPLASAELAVIGIFWLGGIFCLTFPAWWLLALGSVFGGSEATSFAFLPLGAALLLSAPWATHGLAETDLRLMRGLLGPGVPVDRIRTLEETRARAVDASAARLRGIERDLHDGTQAQLVALAMKLGLAMEKLQSVEPVELGRVTQLVGDAHRGTIEAIEDLRTLTRGIHPPVLDNGLTDALATLADRSALPVELVTDIPERPSAAIEAIAYFTAAELLSNVAKHSGARHATLEAVHVPGLLKDRVANVAEFTDAIARVAAGGTALDPEVVVGLLQATRHAATLDALTPRERDVLALMAEGRSNSAIAERYVVSERAVEKHIGNIFGKLGLPPSDSDHRRVLAVLAYLDER